MSKPSESSGESGKGSFLGTMALFFVLVFGALWLGVFLFAALQGPAGFVMIGLISIPVAFLAAVVWQRVKNTEDDYYERTVDK